MGKPGPTSWIFETVNITGAGRLRARLGESRADVAFEERGTLQRRELGFGHPRTIVGNGQLERRVVGVQQHGHVTATGSVQHGVVDVAA